MANPKVYSFKDLVGVFFHPLVGTITFGGEIGVGSITIKPEVNHTDTKIAADGGTMISYVPGRNGTVEIECQQTSEIYSSFLTWYNATLAAADALDVSQFASGTLTVRSLLDGSKHTITGMSPGQEPPKAYAEQGAMLTWTIPAARIINE